MLKPNLINWQIEHSVGLPILDTQHQGMASVANTLYYFMSGHQCGYKILHRAARMVEDFCEIHFETEELVLQQIEDPGWEEHKKRHAELRKYLHTLTYKKNLNYDADEMMMFLRRKWMDHIIGYDRYYIPVLKEYMTKHQVVLSGVGSAPEQA
ncbi:MAG: hemerythrin family protein [Deltaproteobacteria bacterium]|jgi:hemerythrin-like metal-binding protein|nr:hemerythrin family protein [Deltaproteobacteria bacterium]